MGLFSNPAKRFFTDAQGKQIVAAIQAAELNTSGEIRVHLENKVKAGQEIMAQAGKVFHRLGMDDTELRNGVLIFFAVESHRFAILADQGINAVVPQGFWDEIAREMTTRFKQEEFLLGLTEGITAIGAQLKQYFPHQSDDINELPDEISFG
jgi:uncharacterized membrane protein